MQDYRERLKIGSSIVPEPGTLTKEGGPLHLPRRTRMTNCDFLCPVLSAVLYLLNR